MILYMMYRHCLVSPLKASLVGGYITYYPLLFFMAWFFFKGGMFYKDEPVLETARKGLRRLILPYLTFSALALLVSLGTHAILEGAEGIKHVIGEIPVYIKREGALVCNAPLWFLPTLFAVRVLFSAGRWMRIPAPVLAAVGLACGYGLYRADLPIGLYWGNTALGLCFCALGYALKKIQYSQPAFLASLPSPGAEGSTLKSVLKGDPAEITSRIRMKSGSMDGVLCYSGYILPSDGNAGNVIVFSIMTNNCTAPAASVRAALSRAVALLAGEN